MIYYADGFSNKEYYGFSVVNDKNILIQMSSFERESWSEGTNNVAEYMGVISACEIAKSGDTILTDSLLVVQQSNGKWKVKCAHLQEYCDLIKCYIREKNLTLKWIRRNKNLAGLFNEKNEKRNTE